MHTLKLDVEQKFIHDLDLETLKAVYDAYDTSVKPVKAPVKEPPRGSWREGTKQFENPRLQYMTMSVAEFTMAFANQLKKLIKASPNVDKITLTIDNIHKFDLKSYHSPEEIYEELNF